ncbi:MAG: hypothetical protein ACRCX2_36080 [Paraclostridium sp.]
MAKLYGLGNYILSELMTKLIMDKDFNKFVYYKDKKDVLSQPDLDNPFVQLKGQIYKNRRPVKILTEEEVCVFAYLDDVRNYEAKSKKIKTVWINISFLVHNNLSETDYGVREIALISAIEKVVENGMFQSSLGNVEIERVRSLQGLPYEWNGYSVIVKCDGFAEHCVEYEV